jgi:hypothetical protein
VFDPLTIKSYAMQNSSDQPTKEKESFFKLLSVVILLTLILVSCKENVIIIRDQVYTLGTGGSSEAAFAVSTISPPKPDTHFVFLPAYYKIGDIEVDYNAGAQPKSDSKATMTAANSEIISSVSVVSNGKPVNHAAGTYYPMKAVFKLTKSVKSSMLKVSLPNSPIFPEGNETFFLKIE